MRPARSINAIASAPFSTSARNRSSPFSGSLIGSESAPRSWAVAGERAAFGGLPHLDLNRGVFDVLLRPEALLDGAQDGRWIRVGFDRHVETGAVDAGSEGPHVQVVHGEDARHGGDDAR